MLGCLSRDYVINSTELYAEVNPEQKQCSNKE